MRVHQDDLVSIATSIAHQMQPGTPVLFSGPMGVGKSTLVRSIIRKFMPDLGHIPSPSFPIMIPYDAPIGRIWHVDLYRITSPHEIAPLGLTDVMRTELCLIEWPERLGPLLPQRCHRVMMSFVDASENPDKDDLWRQILRSSSADASIEIH